MSEERLQKILAQAGFGSRRSCEVLITANRVTVNGKVATLGQKADPEHDKIAVDGQNIAKPVNKKVYIALNKPRGVLSDTDPADPRPTVFDFVQSNAHLFAVGRLDLDSEGLILLTNDGELANRLTHPRYEHEKEYKVLVAARPDEEQLAAWRRGVVLPDVGKTAPARVTLISTEGKGAWLRVVMHEGKKRQIREVGRTIGIPVVRIIRVRIATLLLSDLKTGQSRELSDSEIAALKASTQEKSHTTFRSPKSRFPGANKR